MAIHVAGPADAVTAVPKVAHAVAVAGVATTEVRARAVGPIAQLAKSAHAPASSRARLNPIRASCILLAPVWSVQAGVYKYPGCP